MISVLIALTASAVAVGMLSQPRRAPYGWQIGGWGLLTLALVIWGLILGPEYGLVLGLTAPSLLAWLIIAKGGQYAGRKQTKPERTKPHQRLRVNPVSVLRHIGLFLLLVPGMGIASSLISVALSYQLPLLEINQLAFCIILLPLLWGIFVYWYFAQKRRVYPLLVVFTLSLISGGALFL